MTQAIIEVKDLEVKYGKRIIIDHISFDVNAGEILMIAGPSGCGKTTLLNQLIGLKKPTTGSIKINGAELVDANEATRQKILTNIGAMFQSGALFSSMTLLQNVCLPLQELTHLPLPIIQVMAIQRLEAVGLEKSINRYPSQLSGGMQKRAAIARAMALMPKILFLDEPAAGLDPITSAQIDALIKHISKDLGMTVIIITHELASMKAISDRIILLADGKIKAQGTFQELQQSSDQMVSEFFNRGEMDDNNS